MNAIRIRPHTTDRNGLGFLVTQSNEGSFQTRIFVLTRAGAEMVKDALYLSAKADAAIDEVLRSGR